MSLYIQLTTRCNMHCIHCCFDCNKNGTDMSQIVWRRLLKLIDFVRDEFRIEDIILGGGEPTLHSDIVEIIEHINYRDIELVTNGSCNFSTWKRLENSQLILSVSYDIFHNTKLIEPWVLDSISEGRSRVIHKFNDERVAIMGRAIGNKEQIKALMSFYGMNPRFIYERPFVMINSEGRILVGPNKENKFNDFGEFNKSNFCCAHQSLEFLD